MSTKSSDGNRKRGKYKTYNDDQKKQIIEYMMIHGIEATLTEFGKGDSRITRKKLRSWLESSNKIKAVKGRKTSDAVRDTLLVEWCMQFQKDNGRPPTRREATKKALQLSKDTEFKASKGWLDKFSRKFEIEFTPMKVFSGKGSRKGSGQLDSPLNDSYEVSSPALSGMSSQRRDSDTDEYFS
mmetsp:Transcript_25335/g.22367  ORF Transcript_25335/g.22367 Transcript_25335/m.22367 type:complete len:183 (+) Transcript_25335:382-930(+)